MRARTLAALTLGVVGCLPVSTPRLPQSVAAALAGHPMRTVESENLRLYFPLGREEEARRFLAHVEWCAGYLKRMAHIHNDVADQKVTVILPELPFNNAFVAPRLAGYDTEAVIPTFNTVDTFSLEMGQPPDPAGIACHEITHYVHAQQIAGFAWFWNSVDGAVYTPQIGLDSWFHEGLAVYYETKLQPGTGRLAWPFWRGAFAAGYAGHRINGGDLHELQRDFHGGNNYLVGSQFVRFLVDRYGEDKLWKLIEVQGRSVFFPLWVNLRFWQAYDKTLSTLIDEFADDVEAHIRLRARSSGQKLVRAAGNSARYARAVDGTEAIITDSHDSPTRLLVYAPDGRLMVERNLTDVVPPRRLTIAAATLTSGLSFTADGRSLYFVAVDIDATYQTARLLRYDIGRGVLAVVHDDLRGSGGSITPDGTRYLFARADGDHHDLAALDLRDGGIRILAAQDHRSYVAHPRVSPDGTRVVAQQFDGGRFRIALFDAANGTSLGVVPTGDGAVHDPSWVDDQHILYLGTSPSSAGFQVFVQDLRGGAPAQVTDAPYLAFEPRAGRGGTTVRFLNREGWGWTVDEVPLKLPPPVPVPPPLARSQATPDAAPAAGADARSVSVPDEGTGTADELPPTSAAMAAAPITRAADAPPPPPAEATPPTPVVAPAETVPDWEQTLARQPLPDRPYSAFDHLFVPSLFGPTFAVLGRQGLTWGLVLSGNDRLSMHRWTVAGYYQFAAGGAGSLLAGYTNRQLAPLTLELNAAQFQVHDIPPAVPGQPTPANQPLTLFRRDRWVTADAYRAFYGNPVDVGALFIERYQSDTVPFVFTDTRRFAGAHLGGRFTGAEATAYGGLRRAVSVGGDVTVYPGSWNTLQRGFTDAAATVYVATPLPLLRRQRLSLRLRARDLIGLPSAQPLLVVGGYSGAVLGRSANRPEGSVVDSSVLPPGLSFVEPLRGFEDYPLLTDRIFVANATYLYPFIVDRGTASALGILPAFFVQQFDLELFGAGATSARDGGQHLAVGAALTLRLALWQVPLDFQVQSARRATDDHGWVQLFTLGM